MNERARQFLEHEQQFRLGFLPTEQPHPLTAGLAEETRRDTAAGLRMLQRVDRELVDPALAAVQGPAFARLVEAMTRSLADGRRIYFTGCGATGRLSILLEAMWRGYWQDRGGDAAREDQVVSVMAGGDYALIRSVEGFEDFTDFGRRQLAEAGVAPGDTVVAISEGGETSFVIGTAWRGLDAGAETFFVFNNPSTVLAEHVERSRRVIDEPRITKLELDSGPMAVAGSTRMQATTLELLVVGAALEAALGGLAGEHAPAASPAPPPEEQVRRFVRLLDALETQPNVDAVAGIVGLEESIYHRRGLVTYFADGGLLDILTDTTERSPTFSLPPFRRRDDANGPRSWSFVKSPTLTTPAAWRRLLRREPRGLTWASGDYERMGAPEALRRRPPELDNATLHRFAIGCEEDASRYDAPASAAIALLVGAEAAPLSRPASPFRRAFDRLAAPYGQAAALIVGDTPHDPLAPREFVVRVELPDSPLRLMDRLAAKLVLNTLSTATMARLGRLVSNWMVHVNTSNKKLIDRGVRLIADQARVDYEHACHELHDTLDDFELRGGAATLGQSPVAVTIERIRAGAAQETV